MAGYAVVHGCDGTAGGTVSEMADEEGSDRASDGARTAFLGSLHRSRRALPPYANCGPSGHHAHEGQVRCPVVVHEFPEGTLGISYQGRLLVPEGSRQGNSK